MQHRRLELAVSGDISFYVRKRIDTVRAPVLGFYAHCFLSPAGEADARHRYRRINAPNMPQHLDLAIYNAGVFVRVGHFQDPRAAINFTKQGVLVALTVDGLRRTAKAEVVARDFLHVTQWECRRVGAQEFHALTSSAIAHSNRHGRSRTSTPDAASRTCACTGVASPIFFPG